MSDDRAVAAGDATGGSADAGPDGTGRASTDAGASRDGAEPADDSAADRAPHEAGFEPPIEPGTPSLENALFVLLGALAAMAVLLRIVQLFG